MHPVSRIQALARRFPAHLDWDRCHLPSSPPIEPCMRFSLTRLSDTVHRQAFTLLYRTVPVRRLIPSVVSHP